MKKEISLLNLDIGQRAIIKCLLVEGDMKFRLYDLGFTKGSEVRCVLKSPLNEPIAYFIKGTTIALRGDTTKNIICERVE